MKKDSPKPDDDTLRGEYELSDLQSGIRGKYLERYRNGTNLALLDSDIRAAFPTDQAVNEALRSIINGTTTNH